MATLQIRKKSSKTWLHIPSDADEFILSKFYCKTDDDIFKIVEESGSSRKEYTYNNITVYDDTLGGGMETFASSQALMVRLEALQYVGFNEDGEVIIADLISSNPSNSITLGSDGKLFSSGGAGKLGLIKIVDKAGDFFTDLATASAYIRTFTSATITDESYSNGTFWFTVPAGSSFGLSSLFLAETGKNTAVSFEDPLGLITTFGNQTLYKNFGNHIFKGATFGVFSFQFYTGVTSTFTNCTFGGSAFDGNTGIIVLYEGVKLSLTTSQFGANSQGRFEIYGNIGTTFGNDYANFFPNSTAVIWAHKRYQTINGGALEGDLARAQTNGAKLFFGYNEAPNYANEFTDEFIYTSGAQNFTTLGNIYAVNLVFRNGQQIIQGVQWTVLGNTVTILDTLLSGESISVNYKTAPTLLDVPYSKLEVNSKVLMSQTEWKNTNIGTQTIANGATLNLLTAVTEANKVNANTDAFDPLSIIASGIKTVWRGARIAHLVRLTFNIATGNAQYYRLDLKRSADNSVVASIVVQRNQAYTTQTIELVTRTLSATDPFVTGGFYLSLTNDSGVSATLNGEMQLVIISNYQFPQ